MGVRSRLAPMLIVVGVLVLALPTAVAQETADLDRIRVSPFEVTLDPGETFSFLATGRDLQGNPVPSLDAMWSTDGGSVTRSGQYTAPDTPGEYTVTATVGALSASAVVTVRERVSDGFRWSVWGWLAVILIAVGAFVWFLRSE